MKNRVDEIREKLYKGSLNRMGIENLSFYELKQYVEHLEGIKEEYLALLNNIEKHLK